MLLPLLGVLRLDGLHGLDPLGLVFSRTDFPRLARGYAVRAADVLVLMMDLLN